MVEFSQKKITSHSLREKLRSIREKKNVSLDEIAKETKIRKRYLELLESGDFKEMPPDVYIKGFLVKYAQYLNIESSDVIKLYNKEKSIEENLKKVEDKKEQKKEKKKINLPILNITPNIIAMIIFVALIGAGFFYFYQEVGKFSETPRLVIVQPASNLIIEGSSVDVEGITDENNKISINGQPVFVDENGRFKENINLQQGLNELEVKAINHFDNESIKKVNVSADYQIEVAEKKEEEKVMGAQDKNDEEKIVLEIRIEESPTWISAEIDKENVQTGTMLPGSIQTLEAEKSISVTSGKANKTFIKINGKDLGQLNESPGIIRNVLFTKDTEIIPPITAPIPEEKPKELWAGKDKEYCKKYCSRSSKNFNEKKCGKSCSGEIAP